MIIIDNEDLPLSVLDFMNKIKERYEFDDTQAIIHMVDLIQKYKMENFK